MLKVVNSQAFKTILFNKSSFIFPMNDTYQIKLRFWSSRKFLGLIDFCHFFTKENFDNKHELFNK